MGTVEVLAEGSLQLRAHIITYGNAADPSITESIVEEIETMWNMPKGKVLFEGKPTLLQFSITGVYEPDLQPDTVIHNTNFQHNFFRIEEFVNGNISFVDDLGSNTGFFKRDNLYQGSTTAAHEFGHTLGLPHPTLLDIRGQGAPGIMYPRGTLVDASFQYNPAIPAGQQGGTMHPMYRTVRKEDVAMLYITKSHNQYIIGKLSNVWHDSHEMFK